MSAPYTINTTIPAANHTPANDQPDMQLNYANINGFLGVDHTAPGSNLNAGMHQQVRFPASNIPGGGGPYIPTLFTDASSPSKLMYWSGSVAQSSSQYNSSSTGSTFCFGGIIVKWGLITFPMSSTSATFSFSSAFPSNCFSVTFSPANARALIKNPYISGTPTVSSFTLSGASTASPDSLYYYVAIGN